MLRQQWRMVTKDLSSAEPPSWDGLIGSMGKLIRSAKAGPRGGLCVFPATGLLDNTSGMRKKLILVSLILSFSIVVPVFADTQSFNRNLYYGLTNDAGVLALQQFLTAQGDYSGPISGNFFSLTQKAVVQFQQNNGIAPASGYFGSFTRAAANNLLSQQSSASAQEQGAASAQSASNVSSQQNSALAQPLTEIMCDGRSWAPCPNWSAILLPCTG